MAQRTQQRPGTARFGRQAAAGRPRGSSERTGRFAGTGTPSGRLGGLPAGRSRTQASSRGSAATIAQAQRQRVAGVDDDRRPTRSRTPTV